MAVGWAMVGPGLLADHVAASMKFASNTEMIGVLSRDKERGAAFADKHGFQRSYRSMDELLCDRDVDAVYLASPHGVHALQAIQAAKGGKHVFVQKPMAKSTQEGEAMIAACQENRVKLGVAFDFRGHPAYVKAREMIASGEIGDVFLVTAQIQNSPHKGWLTGWWDDPSLGSGLFPRGGVHWIDLWRYTLGHEIKEVSAFVSRHDPNFPYEDVALGTFKFENGTLGSMHCSDIVPQLVGISRCEFYGSKGMILGSPFTMKWYVEGGYSFSEDLQVSTRAGSTTYQFKLTNLYVTEIEAFNRAIEENSEPLASGIDGLCADRVSAALYESARSGKSVQLNI